MKKIAVCVSGIAREGYENSLKRMKEIFPYPFFYMQWKGYPAPKVDRCNFFFEPVHDYHCLLDTEYKPNCPLFYRYTKIPNGKLFTKPNLFQGFYHAYKQILAHQYLVDSIDKEFEIIIKVRYDLILSNSKDNIEIFHQLIQKAIHENKVIGISNYNKVSIDNKIEMHEPGDCFRCTGKYLFDHMIIHPRSRLANATELFKNKNLLGAEWGAYQVFCKSSDSKNFLNCSGGLILNKHYFKK